MGQACHSSSQNKKHAKSTPGKSLGQKVHSPALKLQYASSSKKWGAFWRSSKRRYCTCLSYQAMRNRLLQGSSTHFMTAIIRNGPPVGFRCVFRSQRGELFGQIHNFGLIKDGFNLGAAWTWIVWMIGWKEGLQMWKCCRWFPQDGWFWFREARRDRECNGEFECPCAN